MGFWEGRPIGNDKSACRKASLASDCVFVDSETDKRDASGDHSSADTNRALQAVPSDCENIPDTFLGELRRPEK